MIIALDYDDTYTADPELWNQFIDDSIERGHKVLICTARRDTEENREDVSLPEKYNGVVPKYFTGLRCKKKFLEARGIKVGVWIDDNPRVILEDY